MTGTFDVNTLASWAAVVAAVAGAFGVSRKATRWLDSVDERLQAHDEQLDGMRADIKGINAQLRPNGGGSHHDVIVREVRRVAKEAAGDRRRRRWL